jgi:hypothetical protein
MSDVNLFELWTYLISFRIPEEFFKVLEYPERVTAEEKVSCRKFTLTLLLCMLPSLPNTTQPMLANKKPRPDQDPSQKYYLSAEKEKKKHAKSADSQKCSNEQSKHPF